jgi:hypothetical protein
MKKIPDMQLSITKKLFRKRENWKKVLFILKQTNLDIAIITAAASVARLNDFHNFGHQLGAAEMGIKIARAEGLTKAEITEIAFALLFHDATHTGIPQWDDELRAIAVIKLVTSESDIKSFSKRTYDDFMTISSNLILATKFSKRGETHNLLERIMQDADLAHLGQGPEYWLWSSMGILTEFNVQHNKQVSVTEFVHHEQAVFINNLIKKGNGYVYLTEGARSILKDPAKDLELLMQYNERQLQFAYNTRKQDITLDEFKKYLKEMQ